MLLRVVGKTSVLWIDACLTCATTTKNRSRAPPVVGEIEYRQGSKSEVKRLNEGIAAGLKRRHSSLEISLVDRPSTARRLNQCDNQGKRS